MHVAEGVFGDDYRELLRRARVAFNRSIRGECNRRAFEAAAAGAMLFQEAGNREVPDYFRDRHECVFYADDDLEALLEHYLAHEDERLQIAAAARERVRGYSFEALWDRHLGLVEERWPALLERRRLRPDPGRRDVLLTRAGQLASAAQGEEPELSAELEAALAERPHDAALNSALGLVVARAGPPGGAVTGAQAARAVGYFRRAWECDLSGLVAGLNLAEALVGLGQDAAAAVQARQALRRLVGAAAPTPEALGGGRFPPALDHFRVEWERAAWQHAGRPADEARAKRQLLCWRLHLLLAELTGELAHYYEAVLARPDLAPSRAALGCSLGRLGRHADAVPHLRVAVASDPFDLAAARALFFALGEAGDQDVWEALVRECLLLSRAAPRAVPPEDWFAGAGLAAGALASVVVLCCNELAYTRLCLESVLRHTRPPYELVLVDNGSADGTPAYLDEVRTWPGPARVEVIRNETNVGYPAGVNQALARARGDDLVLLNNDVVVTEGWLGGAVRGRTGRGRQQLRPAPAAGRAGVRRPDRARRLRRRPTAGVRRPCPAVGAADRVLPAGAPRGAGAGGELRRTVRAGILRRRPVRARPPGRVRAAGGPGRVRAPLRQPHLPRTGHRLHKAAGPQPRAVPGQVGAGARRRLPPAW